MSEQVKVSLLTTADRLRVNRENAAILRNRIEADQAVLDRINARIAQLEEQEQRERGL